MTRRNLQEKEINLRSTHGLSQFRCDQIIAEGEKQAMTKNDRAERMSQQLWGHHWHEMMGDCFAFHGKSTLEDTLHLAHLWRNLWC